MRLPDDPFAGPAPPTLDKPRRRLNAAVRREMIVETAFRVLASKGFEGLRTREVALEASINSATLHHYFPTKAHLIAAVARHLAARYAAERAPARRPKAGEPPALRRLRQEFTDVLFYRRTQPELVAASGELLLRASRDAATAATMAPLQHQWRSDIQAILEDGRQSGAFRGDLDAVASSALIVSALWGSTALLLASDADYRQMCAEIEKWVLVPPASHRARSTASSEPEPQSS
jgi:AcrR family transcriptional regulator